MNTAALGRGGTFYEPGQNWAQRLLGLRPKVVRIEGGEPRPLDAALARRVAVLEARVDALEDILIGKPDEPEGKQS